MIQSSRNFRRFSKLHFLRRSRDSRHSLHSISPEIGTLTVNALFQKLFWKREQHQNNLICMVLAKPNASNFEANCFLTISASKICPTSRLLSAPCLPKKVPFFIPTFSSPGIRIFIWRKASRAADESFRPRRRYKMAGMLMSRWLKA